MRSAPEITSAEHRDLLESLRRHRDFLRYTTRDLTDEQAAVKPTAGTLCLGGLIKHVSTTEAGWLRFAMDGAGGMERVPVDWVGQFQMADGETLAGLLDAYAEQAAQTDDFITAMPDLNAEHALPSAPWFEPGKAWSVRRVLLHLIAETSQHAGHADIIRETIDGSKTMG